VNSSGDQELDRLSRAAAFEAAALTAIYDEYHPAIYCYLSRRVGDREVARDLAADVFHRLLKAFHHAQGPESHLAAWLYRTAHNALVDHYRRQQHRQHLPLDEGLISDGDEPASVVEQRLEAARVRAALQRLSPDQQQVVALKFFEGLSNEDTAHILGKPVGAVKSLQHRALAALQRHLSAQKEKTL